MSESQFHSSKRQEAAKRLAEDISRLDTASGFGTLEDEEMLSLIVEEASQGIDISKRYPSFYQKLLSNPDLRQAFLDILESIEDEEENLPIPWAGGANPNLSFLADHFFQPVIARIGENWRIILQRKIDQLQSIFFPSELANRSDPTLSEDLWFVLLRGKVDVDGLLYTVALECTFSENGKDTLTPFLNVAITIGAVAKHPPFPIQSSLQWGTYKETISITEEGQVRFPDIPIDTVFDEERKNISSDLSLILESIA